MKQKVKNATAAAGAGFLGGVMVASLAVFTFGMIQIFQEGK
jgi:hypothetical protein